MPRKKIFKLELHPDAAKNFNEKASSLLSELSPKPKRSRRSKGSFIPDWFIAYELRKGDVIGEITLRTTLNGDVTGVFFQDGAVSIGLHGESYKKLIRLAEGIQKIKTISGKISRVTITNLIFDWIKERYRHTTSLCMTEYVLSKCEKEIKPIEIWIPIAMTYIESDFEIGKVLFKPIIREMFNHLRSKIKPPREHRTQFLEFMDKMQKELQGLASATVKLIAEPQRALEIAIEETDKAVSLLRFFSPANFSPQRISYCTLLGKENVETVRYLGLQEDKNLITGYVPFDKAKSWVLDNKEIFTNRADGLDALSSLLAEERRTEFQETLLNAFLLYSKSSLAKDPTDKLVYILVALESILLRNNTEPVMQNISERMAILTFRALQKRKALVSNVKQIYGFRSSYIHHGQSISTDKVEAIEEFMFNAWMFFSQLIANINNFETKEEMIETIEEKKLKGR